MTRALRSRVPLLTRVLAVLVTAGAVLLGLAATGSAATYVPITGAGSTWQYPAIHSWLDALDQYGLSGNYSPNGSQSGLTDFEGGAADWAASEFPYGTPGLGEQAPARGYAYVPDTADAVTLMYNLTINGQRVTSLRLSGATIAGIFTGAITKWNDPQIAADNPGLAMPATPITPVVRSDQSGDTEAFTKWLAATQGPPGTPTARKLASAPATRTPVTRCSAARR